MSDSAISIIFGSPNVSGNPFKPMMLTEATDKLFKTTVLLRKLPPSVN